MFVSPCKFKIGRNVDGAKKHAAIPANVVTAVQAIADIKDITYDEVRENTWKLYGDL
jgi:Tat protein secretion system quality control protein TatD with DNase activity